MAGVKYQEKIHFPEGHIYVLMDDDWGVEITGEDGIGGDLVGMGSWDFSTREAWNEWGNICINTITEIQERQKAGMITADKAIDLIYGLEKFIDKCPLIKKNLKED